MGKIIVIEGTDGSGKETQTKLLLNKLKDLGKNVHLQSFPNYENDGCEPVKMYLNGELGLLKEINGYAASVMFAVDRYTTFRTDLKEHYDKKDKIIVLDRYTTSNMIYQSTKFDFTIDATRMVDWVYDLEHNKLELPKPDIVIFLDMPSWASKKLREGRANKITGEEKQDIHESDEEYLEKVYRRSKDIALRFGWKVIECTTENGEIKTIEVINEEIFNLVEKLN